MLVLGNLVKFVSANVSFGSKFSPSILGNGFVASMLLSIVRLRDLEYSAGSGVNKVAWVLCVLSLRLLSIAQTVIVFRYGCRFFQQFCSLGVWLLL